MRRASQGSRGEAPLDLTSAKRFIAPDDGNRDDQTVMAVALPQPVPPGGSADDRADMDRARAADLRAHRRDRQLLLHRPVVSEARRAAGARAGTATSFTPSTEFFSDYGVYDVALTVPTRLAGRRDRRRSATARTTPIGTTTHRYYQEDVHDFAWTTSPDYIERTARFEHPTLPAVEMRLLLQPEHASQAERHFNATRHDAEALRRMVRRLSVRPHHDRRSGLPERRRRHGVPDAHSRRARDGSLPRG